MKILPIVIILTTIFCYGVVAQAPFQQLEMQPLPLGSVQATGWLKNQLQIQADGLSGHLDEFWPDIMHSGWFGGEAEGWERAPYWLDGVIPLAYTLNDEVLKEKVRRYINIILEKQHDDGWLGPRGENFRNHDIWSLFLALKMLTQYKEATGDERVPSAIERCLKRIDKHIGAAPLRNWAMYRWFEALIPIYWLYEHKQEPWLLDLALKLRSQGFDYGTFFESWPLTDPTPRGQWNFMGHVVNNAMAIKAPALWWRLSGQERDRNLIYTMIKKLDLHHGMVSGIFTGDECLAGKNPTQGTELCAVVENMYSMEVLLSILGDPLFADRLEKITFNALPATFAPDMWSHQYDQQANQVECSINKNRNWTTNGPEANIFGLEPNYGCCTSNLSQGWPKFAAHLWMQTKDSGLAAVAYAPSKLVTNIKGIWVGVELHTEYPFRENLRFIVSVEEPVEFPLYIRIPAWTCGASLVISDEKILNLEPGTFYPIDREWHGKTKISLDLPMSPSASRRYNNSIAIERGPLVYSLKIGEEWQAIHEGMKYRETPHGDWEVYPTTPWNYALKINEECLNEDLVFIEKPVGTMPFSPTGAPVVANVKGTRLPQWQLVNGSAGELPMSPVKIDGVLENLQLIPYGCTNLRVTEFPTLLNKDQRMKWWRKAKFGMFIHWGVYAIPAGVWQGEDIPGIGEWIMAGADIPIPEYEKLPPQFNPVKYDPEEWVRIAKDAGMKYIVITSKHHDGFAIFDSRVSDYDVVDRTPYKKDLLKPLSEASKEAGVKFATYHSILDWHHPAQKLHDDPQYAGKRRRYSRNMIKEGRKDEFILYMKGQLKEIINQYDPAIMWFDGGWMDWWTLEDGKPVLDFLWKMKPDLIINNRATKDSIGPGLGDYGTPEQRIPEQGLDYDWETCMTMNDTWGFKQNDHNWKSTQVLIINLVDVVSKGGNLLLNVGPTAEGLIPQPSIDRLYEMGEWLQVNGEAIYGTKMWKKYKEGPHDVITRYYDLDLERTVPYTAQDIRFTAKDKVIYASCLAWPEEEVKILSLGEESAPDIEIERVSMLGSDATIEWKVEKEQLTLIPPKNKPCDHVFVFKIELK